MEITHHFYDDGAWRDTTSDEPVCVLEHYYGTYGNDPQLFAEDRDEIVSTLNAHGVAHAVSEIGDDDWMIVVRPEDLERAIALLTPSEYRHRMQREDDPAVMRSMILRWQREEMVNPK